MPRYRLSRIKAEATTMFRIPMTCKIRGRGRTLPGCIALAMGPLPHLRADPIRSGSTADARLGQLSEIAPPSVPSPWSPRNVTACKPPVISPAAAKDSTDCPRATAGIAGISSGRGESPGRRLAPRTGGPCPRQAEEDQRDGRVNRGDADEGDDRDRPR